MADLPTTQTCNRCGWVWEVNTTRNKHDNCQSCRSRKAQKVKDCIAWHGHFAADQITPVDDMGNQVMPGYRFCGNSDCVNSAHLDKININERDKL